MLKIEWLGQGGYLLSDGKTVLAIDPYLSDSIAEKEPGMNRLFPAPVAPESFHPDGVICTHDHLDHLDPGTIGPMKKDGVRFFAPAACETHLRSLGVRDYLPFDEGAAALLGAFRMNAFFAKHSAPAVGVIVRAEGLTLAFTGDTLYDSRLSEMKSWHPDFLFICINGKLGNMNIGEAVRVTRAVNPRTAIPAHYGMFLKNTENPELFKDALPNVRILEPGKIYSAEELLG